MRLHLGAEWEDNELVFTTPFGRPLGNNMGREWSRLMRAADGGRGDLGKWGPEPEKPSSGPAPKRSFDPHSSMYILRHTRLTLMDEDGYPASVISKHARHKKVSTTMTHYVHSEVTDTKQAVHDSLKRLMA